jgi:hypothetical protein
MSIQGAIEYWGHMLSEVQAGVDEFYFWREDDQDELVSALNTTLEVLRAQQELSDSHAI